MQDTAITPRSVKLAPSSPPNRQLSKTALESFENAESCISPFLQDKVRSHSNYAMLSCAYYHLTCLYESTLKKKHLTATSPFEKQSPALQLFSFIMCVALSHAYKLLPMHASLLFKSYLTFASNLKMYCTSCNIVACTHTANFLKPLFSQVAGSKRIQLLWSSGATRT